MGVVPVAAWQHVSSAQAVYGSGVVDYIGRALVTEALQEWRAHLEQHAACSPLRDLRYAGATVIDVRSAHPSGLARLFAGRPTPISLLQRDDEAIQNALHRATRIVDDAETLFQATGVHSAALAVGTVLIKEPEGSWIELPIVLRPLLMEVSREGDVELTLRNEAYLNPVLAAILREHPDGDPFPRGITKDLDGKQFDPRPVWSKVVDVLESMITDVRQTDRLIIGAFDDPEQRLVDDLRQLDSVIARSPVFAALAGDANARAQLSEPLPAFPLGDRDPFAERGLGDLDDSQFAALDVIATGRHAFVQAPPGADVAGTVAAIAADAAASGKTVGVVSGDARGIRSVAHVLNQVGAGDLFVSGAEPLWNTTACSRLLESMTAGSPEVNEQQMRQLGDRLLNSRFSLYSRFDGLHRTHRPWGVSAYEAVQAVVRLTAGEPLPATTVRLGHDAGAVIAENGFGAVAAAIVELFDEERAEAERLLREQAEEQRLALEQADAERVDEDGADSPVLAADVAEDLAADANGQDDGEDVDSRGIPVIPGLREPLPDSAPLPLVELAEDRVPWWSTVVTDATVGAAIDDALGTLTLRHLPRLRTEAAIASHETGVDQAPSLAVWAEQVQLFDDVRATLDTFNTAVFHRSLTELVAATAPADSPRHRSMPRRDRRAYMRRAAELLRPGRGSTNLHDALVKAQEQAGRWRAHCSAGGWPMVPDDYDMYVERIVHVQFLWERLAPVIASVTGINDLIERPWDEMTTVLEDLAAGVPGIADTSRPEDGREIDLALDGFVPLVDNLRSRGATPEQIRVDLEFSWWAAAFDAIVTNDARLTEYGAIGDAVKAFLEADGVFAATRVRPLTRAVAERRRTVIARNPDQARDTFATLVERKAVGFKDLWGTYPAVIPALRPVVLAQADQVPHMAPAAKCFDVLILTACESLALAEVVPALARAEQVVVVGDAKSSTRSAVTQLAQVLPVLPLPPLPQPRDPRVTRVLVDSAYGRALPTLPAAGDVGRLRVLEVTAQGKPVAGHGTVESTREEIDAVVDHIAQAMEAIPRKRLLIVASNPVHAGRIESAIEARNPRWPAIVPVATLGDVTGFDVDEIVLALGYARDTEEGMLPADLGLLSTPEGVQAVVQAIVASREDVTVVATLKTDEMAAIRAPGLSIIRDLVVASQYPPVPAERPAPGPSDWLFADVADRLRKDGYAVRLRYGWGGEAIPMVVGSRHDRGHRVAVITDEAPLVGNASLRDRIRWQYRRLEALGWVVVPLWTVDVFMDPAAATQQIKDAVDAALEAEKADLTVALPHVETRVKDRAAEQATEQAGEAAPVAVTPVDQLATVAIEVPDRLRTPVSVESADSGAGAEAPASTESFVSPVSLVSAESADSVAEGGTPAVIEPTIAPEPEPEPELAEPSEPAAPVKEQPLLPSTSWSESAEAWGDRDGRSRDDEIRGDKPPHW